MTIFLYILVGFIGGLASGAFGIGGGAIIVPALVFIGLTQHEAQGTTLAVLMAPVFVLAVLKYYAAGNVKIQIAIFVAIGLLLGSFLGANWVQGVPSPYLKKAFGVFLILIGIKMFL